METMAKEMYPTTDNARNSLDSSIRYADGIVSFFSEL